MKIVHVHIGNFRGIAATDLLMPAHAVIIGDNNVGKSTVLEAVDLCLGPDRAGRRPPVDEHDFYKGHYIAEPPQSQEGILANDAAKSENPRIEIDVTIIDLSDVQQDHFGEQIEWWDNAAKSLYAGDLVGLDGADVSAAIRVSFRGYYHEDEDDFVGETFFTRSLTEDENPTAFRKKDKQLCGFLYLRTVRTGSRALSLEHGSLLDIILRLKELRGGMWEDTIGALKDVDVASDPRLGLSGVLESVNKALNKYVPKEWGAKPQLRVSNLTREHLRKVITAFMSTGDGDHTAPFYRQGTGTINMLVLALLSQIAEDKQNVIFAMEEVETAIPPYAQKRIVHELRKLSSQSIVTTHSPYVLEEYSIEETVILARSALGVMTQASVELPDGVKLKRYRSEFRQRFCEGLLASRVLIAEGATEMSSFSAVARRLSELDTDKYSSLEAMGICVVDAGTDSQVAPFAKMYKDLGKQIFAACDKQTPEIQAAIEAEVTVLFMHEEHGIEDLVLKGTTPEALKRFADTIEWPPHLMQKFGDPAAKPVESLSALFSWNKGGWSLPDFLAQCTEAEIPEFLRSACAELKEHCLPAQKEKPGFDGAAGEANAI